MDTLSFIDAGGWIGAFFLTTAYAVVTFRPLADRKTYHWLNIAGCLLLILSTASHRAWPSAVGNLIWIGIGGISLLRQRAHKTERRSASAPEANQTSEILDGIK
jgi:hypothetical protein